ncbi:MAG: SDR family oxidoreductase [Betaproteobacteria bacterium]|nr:SDR family oxidoreductase [Betaproteobacteria bacterium]
MKPLASRTALVTGSSRGIGRAIAIRLATDGAIVVVHYQSNRAAAEATVRDIESAGGQALAIQGDIGSVVAIKSMFAALDDALQAKTGSAGLDILVNNAGVFIPGMIQDYTEADFDRQVGTNFKGPFFVTQAAISRLRDGGRVINISSGTARRANPATVAYAASKAALNYLGLAMAAQLGERKITVNTLAPGLTATDMVSGIEGNPVIERTKQNTVLGRIGNVHDVAETVAFLAGPGGGWITGEVIYATGGELL